MRNFFNNLKSKENININLKEFEKGNYHKNFLEKRDNLKCLYAAFLGIPNNHSLKSLKSIGDQKQDFIIASSLWINGFVGEAKKILKKNKNCKKSEILLQIIKGKKRSKIIIQCPTNLTGPQTLFAGIKDISELNLDIKFIGYEKDDGSKPLLLSDYIDPNNKPLFYLSFMGEWHQPPLDIAKSDIPIFMQTADVDIHRQQLQNYFSFVDSIITTDQTEWEKVKKFFPNKHVVTLPTPFFNNVNNQGAYSLIKTTNKIQYFLSGILFCHYHYDKIELITKLLLDLHDEKGLIIDGGLIYEKYLELQRISKFSINFYRHKNGMVTRAIDAANQGTIPIVHKNNIFLEYVNSAKKFSFTDNDDIKNLIKNCTEKDYSEYSSQIKREVGRELNQKICATKYIKSLVVESLLQTSKKNEDNTKKGFLDIRRRSSLKFWNFDKKKRSFYSKSYRRILQKQFKTKLSNLSLREETLNFVDNFRDEYAAIIYYRDSKKSYEYFSLRNSWNQLAYKSENLVDNFNAIRFIHFYGRSSDNKIVLNLIDKILNNKKSFKISIFDDVFPPDYLDHSFDYRQFLNLDNEKFLTGNIPKNLIFSALFHIKFKISKNHDDILEAHKLNPNYGPLNFDLLISLLENKKKFNYDSLIKSLCFSSAYTKLTSQIVYLNLYNSRSFLQKNTIKEICLLYKSIKKSVVFFEKNNLLRGISSWELIKSNKLKKPIFQISYSEVTAFLFTEKFDNLNLLKQQDFFNHTFIFTPWISNNYKPRIGVSPVVMNSNYRGYNESFYDAFTKTSFYDAFKKKYSGKILIANICDSIDFGDNELIHNLIDIWDKKSTIAIYDSNNKRFIAILTNSPHSVFSVDNYPFLGHNGQFNFEVILRKIISSGKNLYILDKDNKKEIIFKNFDNYFENDIAKELYEEEFII